jgi:hypothetical protein
MHAIEWCREQQSDYRPKKHQEIEMWEVTEE